MASGDFRPGDGDRLIAPQLAVRAKGTDRAHITAIAATKEPEFGRARVAGDRNLAAFSVARLAGLFSPLLLPTACAVGYQTVARFAGSSGEDRIAILASTPCTRARAPEARRSFSLHL